jgi:hypothetical protein
MSELSLREMIDAAKKKSEAMDASATFIATPDGMREVKRRVPRESRSAVDEIDASNVAIAPDKELAAMLVGQLMEIRSQKRELDDRDAAIKEILEGMTGELEYLAVEDGAKPLISLKHESSVRVKTAAVKELLPAEDNPELYSTVSSRPLRLMS